MVSSAAGRVLRDAPGFADGAHNAKLVRDTLGYHASPGDARAAARAAGVRRLVLTHMTPPPRGRLLRALVHAGSFVEADPSDASAAWDGTWEHGEDGYHYTLPPAPSRAIARERLGTNLAADGGFGPAAAARALGRGLAQLLGWRGDDEEAAASQAF